MSERFLTAMIYRDSITPDLSAECAVVGLNIVKEIAPWIRVEQAHRTIKLGRSDRNFVNVDSTPWPKPDADLSIVLTTRDIVERDDIRSYGNYALKKLPAHEQRVGMALQMSRVNSRRIAIINTASIRRPEHVVAHEVGHLFGVQLKATDNHCKDNSCLMSARQYEYGRAKRNFCLCCSNQLHDNSLRLRHAKSGKLGLAPNARIF
jgi:hypothetical protein